MTTATGQPRTSGAWCGKDRIYPDTGCPDLGIPSCLRCPLPRCRYDGEERTRIYRPPLPDGPARVAALRADGLTTPEIAARLGVSERTVTRLMRRAARG